MAGDQHATGEQGDGQATNRQLANEAYTVGWICAIHTEYVAARLFLDDEHESPEYVAQHDNNNYTLGKMGQHNVVIAVLPDGEYGIASAATVARDMLHSFPNVRIGLMVGIGGGAPSAKNDIRLGDVVVSARRGDHGGVFQYDFGKTIQDQKFRETGFLAQPPSVLRSAMNGIKAQYEIHGHRIQEAIKIALEMKQRLQKKYDKPFTSADRLYHTHVTHPIDDDAGCPITCGSDDSVLVSRPLRGEDDDNPAIHYGLIASANQLMKDAKLRDKLAQEKDVLCFEMEAAGLMNHFPCLVIRGICDYADSHKSKEWQGYAAMAAAAYAKDILGQIVPNKVEAESKLSKLLLNVSDQVSTVQEQVTHNQSVLDRREREDILNWLAPVDYGLQHSDHLRRHQPGTGQWLLSSEEYRTWLGTRQQTLFCSGMPGAGKTILTSIVIDHLERSFSSDDDSAIAFVYCNYKRREKVEDLIASLLKQVAQARPSLPAAIKELHSRHAGKGTRPSLHDTFQALKSIASEHSRVFIVVDALDECQTLDDCQPAADFISTLFGLQVQCNTSINLFATSRTIPEISNKFKGGLNLEISAQTFDILKYLERHVANLGAVVTQSPGLKDMIIETIASKADGMFLLVQLYLESLRGKDTPWAIKEALSGMVPGTRTETAYNTAYENAVERIKQRKADWERAKQVFGWITCAKRQLLEVELQHALAVGRGDSVLNDDKIPPTERLVSVCAGLVIIDKQSGIIRLVHYTAQDYFESEKTRWFPDIESIMTRVCTTYLSFDSFAADECRTRQEFVERLASRRLYDYAAQNWGFHAQTTNADDTPEVLSFLSKPQQVDTASRSVPGILGECRAGYVHPPSTALHLAAYFGLAWAVEIIVDAHTIDARDGGGRTPLHWASSNGYPEVAKLLIEKGANVDSTVATFDATDSSREKKTPLRLATVTPHIEVVKLLLEKGANVDLPDEFGNTILHEASSYGYTEVVRLLLEKGADVNLSGVSGTPLHEASLHGSVEVVRLLLEKGADVNLAEESGETPLHTASRYGYTEVVRLLLEKGANANAAKNNGTTPLFLACVRKQGGMAKLLIENGADVTWPGEATDDEDKEWIGHELLNMGITKKGMLLR